MAKHRSIEDQIAEFESAGVRRCAAINPKRARAAHSKRTETLADMTASPPKKPPRKRPGSDYYNELRRYVTEQRASVAQERVTTVSPPGGG